MCFCFSAASVAEGELPSSFKIWRQRDDRRWLVISAPAEGIHRSFLPLLSSYLLDNSVNISTCLSTLVSSCTKRGRSYCDRIFEPNLLVQSYFNIRLRLHLGLRFSLVQTKIDSCMKTYVTNVPGLDRVS